MLTFILGMAVGGFVTFFALGILIGSKSDDTDE